jgi:hypothetical protein
MTLEQRKCKGILTGNLGLVATIFWVALKTSIRHGQVSGVSRNYESKAGYNHSLNPTTLSRLLYRNSALDLNNCIFRCAQAPDRYRTAEGDRRAQ